VPDLDYRLAWLLVRGAVFVAWNSPLHHEYVFEPPPPPSPPRERDKQPQAPSEEQRVAKSEDGQYPKREQPPQLQQLVGQEGGQPAG
jgi:hypothetical protein